MPDLRHPPDDLLFLQRAIITVAELLQDAGWQRGTANRRQQRGHFQLPHGGGIDEPGKHPHRFAQTLAAAECLRRNHAQDFREHLDAAHERAFQQLLFHAQHFKMLQTVFKGGHKRLGRAGLVEEAINVPAIDRIDCGLLVGISGQHHSHGIGREFLRLLQELHPIHPGHAHIHHDQGIGTLSADFIQALGSAQGRVKIKLLAQVPLESRQQVRVVVDEENFVFHKDRI